MSDRLLRRMACMVEIANRKQDKRGRLGKTAMQKLAYLLQALYGVPLGYDFEFYTYGPYDSGVMRDIDYARATGLLQVEYEGDGGYVISQGENADAIEAYRVEFAGQMREQLDSLFSHFGDYNAGELELRATMVFVKRDNPSITDDELVRLTKDLKPKFSDAQIADALADLTDMPSFAQATLAANQGI